MSARNPMTKSYYSGKVSPVNVSKGVPKGSIDLVAHQM